jgi:hypothetical protein
VPANLKIDVTQELIDQATERDSRRCMIAEAIKEAKPHYERVIVDLQTIRWTNPRTKKRYLVLTPEAVGVALVAFDQGEPIEPFSIWLKPSQVTAIATRERRDDRPAGTRGGSAYRAQKTRGQKKLVVDNQGRVHVEGGGMPPTGHLSNVKISRNDVRLYGRRLLRA